MKQGLIFDLDGTLVNSLAGLSASLNFALGKNGLPEHPPAVVRAFIGNGARILVERAVPPGTVEDLILAVERNFRDDYEITWPDGTAPYEGILGMLGKLQQRRHPLAVLSNKPHAFTFAMVTRVFSGIHFTTVLGQRDGIPHKPDPAGALEIAAGFGLRPEDCTIIGDSTPDIETARNAGMKSIAVTWGFHDRGQITAAGPDRIVESPAEISALFR